MMQPLAGTAREVVRAVLLRVERDGAYAAPALASALERSRLGAADRGLATEIVYGVLRRRARLDRALEVRAARGGLQVDLGTLIALRVAAYQILFLDRVPDHAAVDEAVETIKTRKGERLGGFANALLRRLAREGEPLLPDARDEVARAALETSLPSWIEEEARAAFGHGGEGAGAAIRAFAMPAPTWLRANTLRAAGVAEILARIEAECPGAEMGRSPAVPEALALRRASRSPAELSVFREGLVAVQDLGAQAVARLLGPTPGARVLDACAGLGGKTAHLAALAGARIELVAADRSARKLEAARREWARLGVENVATVVADLTDPRADLGSPYDAVLLDAPCSGLGVLRRHPEIKWRRGAEDLAGLADLQARLLRSLLARVRAGGVLVYSVCTFSRVETEEHLHRLLGEGGVRVEPPADPALRDLCDARGILRTRPDRDDADAFFAVRLRVG